MSTPARFHHVLRRGDDYSVDLTMTTDGTNGINIGGWSGLLAHIRTDYDSTTSTSFTVAIVNTAGGIVRLSLTTTQTALLPMISVWDLQRTSSGALQTVVTGSVTVHPDVTHT
jgi:hypothetical protein